MYNYGSILILFRNKIDGVFNLKFNLPGVLSHSSMHIF